MTPTPATSALAYIKQCKPVLRGEVSKVAYLMHTYATLSDCTLIGLDERPRDIESAGDVSAQEVEMPAELENQDFASLHYRTPHGALIEVAVMRADNELLLHWASRDVDNAHEASRPIHSVSIPLGKYFTDSEHGADAYQREHVSELMEQFTVGLDILLQANDRTAASPGDAASRPQQADPGRPDHMPTLPPVQPLHAIHPHASPLMDGVPALGGSHVGPGDPIFAGMMRGRHHLGSSVNPPGARFDPIAPDGLPGSHPDDFLGPGQADGWHDVGPPPGRNMPGRRGGPGHDPFGGFM